MLLSQGLVVGAEVWVPRGELMVFGSGAYGPHAELREASRQSQFRVGEGLPGSVRATGKTLLWTDLGKRFLRAQQTATAGIDAALGIPWFRGNELVAVVAMLLRRSSRRIGGLEIWNLDESINVLTHAGGYYVGCAEFETLSPMLQFPVGVGLPGQALQTARCQVMPDIRTSNAFIRAGLAARAGIKVGIGIPVCRAGQVPTVLTLLASEEHPWFREVSVFAGPTPTTLALAESVSALPQSEPPTANRVAHLRNMAERATTTGAPFVQRDETGGAIDFSMMMVLPNFGSSSTYEVMCIGL